MVNTVYITLAKHQHVSTEVVIMLTVAFSSKHHRDEVQPHRPVGVALDS